MGSRMPMLALRFAIGLALSFGMLILGLALLDALRSRRVFLVEPIARFLSPTTPTATTPSETAQ